MTKPGNKTILVAIDTAPTSKYILREALVLASSTRSQVVLTSITPQYEGNMNRFLLDDAEREFAEPFQQVLRDGEAYAHSLGVQIETVSRVGKPCQEIIAIAEEIKASLIVLGCIKRNQVERMLLGRTSAEVIANSPCDVMLIPEDAEIRFRKLLVGINGTSTGEMAVYRAIEIAESYGSKINGLYAIDLPPNRSMLYAVRQNAEQKARDSLMPFKKITQEHEIPAVTVTMFAPPEKALADYAAQHDIHLIILGAKPAPSIFDIFRESINEAITAWVHCPILVAKEQKDGQKTAISHFA